MQYNMLGNVKCNSFTETSLLNKFYSVIKILPLTSSSIFASISSRAFITVKKKSNMNKWITNNQPNMPPTNLHVKTNVKMLKRCKTWEFEKACICQPDTKTALYDTTSSAALTRFHKVKLVKVIRKFTERFLRLTERLKK